MLVYFPSRQLVNMKTHVCGQQQRIFDASLLFFMHSACMQCISSQLLGMQPQAKCMVWVYCRVHPIGSWNDATAIDSHDLAAMKHVVCSLWSSLDVVAGMMPQPLVAIIWKQCGGITEICHGIHLHDRWYLRTCRGKMVSYPIAN